MRILELDAGNSRLKWRVSDTDGIVSHGYLANSDDWHQELPLLMGQIGQIDCARASIVSGNERFELLNAEIDRHFNIPLLQAEVKSEWRGVRVAYPGLGVDRWLAMLAANHQDQRADKLVVSCGTAITLDVLSNDGEHSGGYIVPGVGLMKRMLHANTAQLPMVETAASDVMPGKNSIDCINNGILAMVAAMVNTQQAIHKTSHKASYKDRVVYLTGGDGALLKPYIHGECFYYPELVMNGLALAFEDA
ncbi:type III pantothenate kinase [Endozoicomonas sp.]|uniref:type III pantothenate kinase n=1 Tax=Endozoicomonas sp. TaxID=1892382 RepID=UPI0028864963|nr:type III pantothenate kinase [Endozoicomonas sp.]